MDKIVHSLKPVTLVGGGPVGRDDLSEALKLAPVIVAADSGALPVLEAGVIPDAVMGDFDSLSEDIILSLPADRMHHTPDQNYTDFDKALRLIEAPCVIAAGFTGGRMDHQMAALHTLVTRADRACVLLSQTEIVVHCPPRLALPTKAGETVSLFPLLAVTGRSDGLEWPLQGHSFAPDQFIGTSNRALGPCVLEMDGPGMLGIFPRRLLGALTQALVDAPAPARWPVRASLYKGPQKL